MSWKVLHIFPPIHASSWTTYDTWRLLWCITTSVLSYCVGRCTALCSRLKLAALAWYTYFTPSLGHTFRCPIKLHCSQGAVYTCTWPIPISSTSKDPIFIFVGLMMQVAMQIGLYRPSHAQDFTRFKIELRDEEMKARVKTWVACNMVSQR